MHLEFPVLILWRLLRRSFLPTSGFHKQPGVASFTAMLGMKNPRGVKVDVHSLEDYSTALDEPHWCFATKKNQDEIGVRWTSVLKIGSRQPHLWLANFFQVRSFGFWCLQRLAAKSEEQGRFDMQRDHLTYEEFEAIYCCHMLLIPTTSFIVRNMIYSTEKKKTWVQVENHCFFTYYCLNFINFTLRIVFLRSNWMI